MKKYYIHTTKQEGPFSIDDLKVKNIKRDTSIWFEGLSEWMPAENIDELKILEVKRRRPLPEKDLREAERFVKKYHEGIIDKWTTFFVKNKKVKCEVITQKI
jgi:hypothetical protein